MRQEVEGVPQTQPEQVSADGHTHVFGKKMGKTALGKIDPFGDVPDQNAIFAPGADPFDALSDTLVDGGIFGRGSGSGNGFGHPAIEVFSFFTANIILLEKLK